MAGSYSARAVQGLLRIGEGDAAVPVVATRYDKRVIVRGEDLLSAVSLRHLRLEDGGAGRLALVRTDQAGWRLALEEVPRDSWVRDVRARRRLPKRRLAIAAGLVAAIIGGSWLGREDIVAAAAPLLPHSVTDAIGREYLTQLGRRCDAGPGNAALARLTAKLLPATLPEPVSVKVFDNPEINAVALPGGHVVLYRGLIAQARSPDEIAAVLAHEIEHVAFQHPNQTILRESGPAVVARTLNSDAGRLATLTVLKKGNKAAEAEADTGAIALLGAAGISTRAAADFFERQGSLASIFSASHPSDAARARRFAGAARSNTAPALTPAEWQALQAICTA